MGESTKIDKRCAKCGRMMHDVSRARRYCDVCRYGFMDLEPAQSLKHPKYTGPSIREIMKEATKEGLQYAEYRKKHNLH